MGSPTVHQIIHCWCAIHCIAKLHIEDSGENFTFQIIFLGVLSTQQILCTKVIDGVDLFWTVMGLASSQWLPTDWGWIIFHLSYLKIKVQDDIKEVDLTVNSRHLLFLLFFFFFIFLHFFLFFSFFSSFFLDQVRGISWEGWFVFYWKGSAANRLEPARGEEKRKLLPS